MNFINNKVQSILMMINKQIVSHDMINYTYVIVNILNLNIYNKLYQIY